MRTGPQAGMRRARQPHERIAERPSPRAEGDSFGRRARPSRGAGAAPVLPHGRDARHRRLSTARAVCTRAYARRQPKGASGQTCLGQTCLWGLCYSNVSQVLTPALPSTGMSFTRSVRATTPNTSPPPKARSTTATGNLSSPLCECWPLIKEKFHFPIASEPHVPHSVTRSPKMPPTGS